MVYLSIDSDVSILTGMETAILKTLAYGDIFDYPLTDQEIYRYLIGMTANEIEVEETLSLASGRKTARFSGGSLQLRERISYQSGYYTLRGRESIVEIRKRRHDAASRAWPYAIAYGKLIGRLPFVRMVSITGALAMKNIESGSDMDYLIVTQPGRLWLCRAMVILIVRWAERRGVVICPNYFLSELALSIQPETLYTAHELVQMVPVSGSAVYANLRSLNGWTNDYLPNASNIPGYLLYDLTLPEERKAPFLKSLGEKFFSLPVGDWLDGWEMRRKIRKFSSHYNCSFHPGRRVEEYEGSGSIEPQFGPDRCKGHFSGHGQRVLQRYHDRLAELGLLPDMEY